VAKPNWQDRLMAQGRAKSFGAGQAIFMQGDRLTMIGLVIKGQVKAVTYTDQGDETWIAKVCMGELFGSVALATGDPVNFEITAERKSEILLVPLDALRKILAEDPELAFAFTKEIAARLDHMTMRLVEAVNLSAPGRVCAELLRLSKPIGIDPDKSVIRPGPVFVELARHVSSTRETVSRTVNELIKAGIVSKETGALLIMQPERLEDRIR